MTPTRRPALTKAPARQHPVAPAEQAEFAAPPKKATVMISARVDVSLRQAVRRYGVDHDMSVQDIVTDALEKYLAQHGRDDPRLRSAADK